MKRGFLCISMFLFSLVCFADDSGILPADQFLSQIFDLVKSFGGLSWTMKIAGIILLVIASMKVSFLKPLWDKMGFAKAIIAPALGLLAGLFSLGPQMSFAGIMAYCLAGSGAIVLHELMDGLKGIPGIGPIYVEMIEIVSKFFMKPDPVPSIEAK